MQYHRTLPYNLDGREEPDATGLPCEFCGRVLNAGKRVVWSDAGPFHVQCWEEHQR